MEKVCGKCGRVFKTEADFLNETDRWRVCDEGHLWFNCSCHSTLLVKKGQFDWYSPTKFMSVEAQSVFNRLSEIGSTLPHLPNSIMKIQTLLEDEEVNTTKVAKELKKAPLLGAEVLKMAENIKSNRVGDGKKLGSLTHAIVYIGHKALKDLVVAASIKIMKFNTSQLNSTNFWHNSYLTASIAETLAKKYAKEINPDQAYLAGALCNIGVVAGAIVLPQEADNVYSMTVDKLQDWRKSERKLQAVSHCILGEVASAIWGMPAFVRDSAVLHHAIPTVMEKHPDANFPKIHHVIALANQLSHWVNLNPHRIDENVLYKTADAFGLDRKGVDTLADKLISLRKDIIL